MTTNKISNNNSNMPKLYQASIGLGIVTHISEPPTTRESKNDTFFDISTTYAIKPPPSLTTQKTNYTHNYHTTFVTDQEPQLIPPSFADRIRYIVQANKKSAVAPTPQLEKLDGHLFEKIIPLPSPSQPDFFQHMIPPVDDQPSLVIPIISLSPNFSPNKTNIIPSLLEDPMLGDIEDQELGSISKEFKLPSPNEDNLIGKNIWKFRLQKLLGIGAFSKVYLAENIEHGEKVAIKMINKDRMIENLRVKTSIEREVGLLKFLSHDHIVQLEATMETENHLCIVLEYVQGEELFDFVQRMHIDIHREGSHVNIDERLIRRLALELVQVVTWLHDHNIVHRDLKLENILVYYSHQDEPHLKLTDFGLARVLDPENPTLTTRCGSEEYAAPEIVQSLGYDGRLTDTWSFGIILYALLVGYLPFSYNPNRGEKLSHLFHRIVLAQVKWPKSDNISTEAKDVVNSILVRQPEKRIKLHQLSAMAWFNT
ncbi:kinase-like domain-containing protein [Helicostylum pulchrum]|nr:kinase-like domain-containing protein [Helicostylum pulchrum]